MCVCVCVCVVCVCARAHDLCIFLNVFTEKTIPDVCNNLHKRKERRIPGMKKCSFAVNSQGL